jgi:hypothetical protein
MVTVPWAKYEALLNRYNALVQEVLALKRDGFVRPEELREPAQPAPLPDLVQKAISEIAIGDAGLTHQLVDAAWELLKGGMEIPEVAARITQGETIEL